MTNNKEVEKIYVIHAYEGIYCGLHGMEEWLLEKTTLSVAEDIAEESSYNVMDSYSYLFEDFETQAEGEGFDPGTEEYDEYINDLRQENVAYEIYEVYKTDGKMLEELEKMMCKDPDYFIKEYCKNI